jgi:hypothetical protein
MEFHQGAFFFQKRGNLIPPLSEKKINQVLSKDSTNRKTDPVLAK